MEKIDRILHTVTTLIISKWGTDESHASGFFYYELKESSQAWNGVLLLYLGMI